MLEMSIGKIILMAIYVFVIGYYVGKDNMIQETLDEIKKAIKVIITEIRMRKVFNR